MTFKKKQQMTRHLLSADFSQEKIESLVFSIKNSFSTNF
jgi:hypothetical protein